MWIRAVDVEGAGGDGDWLQYGYGMADAIVADDAVLDAIHATDEVRAALDEHGVVMLDREVSGTVVLQAPGGIELPGVAAGNRYTLGYVSPLLLTEAAARAAELDVATTGTVLQSDDALTADQRRELEDLQDDLGWVPGSGMAEESTSYLNLSWHEPDGGPSPFQLELLLSGVALVLALFVVGVSLALAAAESKDESDVLTIAGAPPRDRKSTRLNPSH